MSIDKEEEKAILKVYLPSKPLRDRFKAACALNATNMNEAIVEFVRQYVEENETSQRRSDPKSHIEKEPP